MLPQIFVIILVFLCHGCSLLLDWEATASQIPSNNGDIGDIGDIGEETPGPECAASELSLTVQPKRIALVLDRSSSMRDYTVPFEGGEISRWDAAVWAMTEGGLLRTMISASPDKIEGLPAVHFISYTTHRDSQYPTGSLWINGGPSTADTLLTEAEVIEALRGDRFGATPTDSALEVALEADPDLVILATDGQPNWDTSTRQEIDVGLAMERVERVAVTSPPIHVVALSRRSEERDAHFASIAELSSGALYRADDVISLADTVMDIYRGARSCSHSIEIGPRALGGDVDVHIRFEGREYREGVDFSWQIFDEILRVEFYEELCSSYKEVDRGELSLVAICRGIVE